MRKQTKLVAVLSAAALLAIGASMTSFAAAAHWDQQDGEWVYLDRNGDRMTDVWRKSNNQWYYLDENGYMAREQVIEDDDDKYYVDANGVRVTNAWVSLDNDDLLDDDGETDSIDTVWMYFDGTGKALGAGKDNGEIKRLTYGDNQSGYFIFNNEGYMLSGWKRWSRSEGLSFEGDLYYLGTQDEGWAHTGWNYLEIDPDIDAFEGIQEDDDEYNDQEYFYFKPSGKAVVDDDESIGGRTYVFDEYGRMLDLWVYPENATSGYTNSNNASSSNATASFYREDNGGREKDWVFAYPNTSYDNYSDDPYWFYLDSNGRPFRADASTQKLNRLYGENGNDIGAAMRVDDTNKGAGDEDDAKYNGKVAARAIRNQTYLFNDKGVMLTGLYWLGGDSDKENADAKPVHKGTSTTPMNPGYYYFTIDGDHTAVEGQMVTNKRITIDVNGDDETYYFKKTGEAHLSAVINGYIYGPDGKLVTSYGDGNTYQRVKISEVAMTYGQAKRWISNVENKTDVADTDFVLVDKSGKIEFSTSDSDVEVLINENGKIRKTGTTTDVNDQRVPIKSGGYEVDQENIENRD